MFIYSTVRALVVRKDVLPILQLSCLIYQFECLHCCDRYIGRTCLQHLGARIRQHVPLHLLPAEAKASRPRRGRPPKSTNVQPPTPSASAPDPPPPTTRRVTRSQTASAMLQVQPTATDTEPSQSQQYDPSDYQSAVAKHVVVNSQCLSKYSDSCFTVLCRARSSFHCQVLEAVLVQLRKPEICVQKKLLVLKLFPP